MPRIATPRIAKSVTIDERGACVPVALHCLPQLRATDRVIQGWVQFGKRGWWHEHTWMWIKGKGRFDPTLEQFRKLRRFSAEPRRKIAWVFSPHEFRREWLEVQTPWWVERCKQFGVHPPQN